MSMTVDDLRKAGKNSSNVGYMTFIKYIREDKSGLFCFFEGKDSPYYISRVRSVFQGNYYPINCTGKRQVLKAFELIQNHNVYDKYKRCFFIDRDFDPPENNPKIYETPCYSIENLYVSIAVFGEILKSEWGFLETDDDFKRCVEVYTKLQQEFHEAVLLFNAWYGCLIDKKHELKQKTNASLDDKMPKGFITIGLGGVRSNYDFSAIKAEFPDALKVTKKAVTLKEKAFKKVEQGLVFRGKFELHFMLMILDELKKDSNKPKKDRTFISKPVKYNITHSQAISQFSQYAETPPELITYIQNCTS